MSKKAWGKYFIGDINLNALLDREDVKADNKNKIKGFFSLFDQVNPTKTKLIPASALQKMVKQN
jgi:hypothetical protein